jgi:3-oxoacyl-[acyl-carrier protein] reductase
LDLGIAGKISLVTGASTGIGHATALLMAAEGATVVAAARNRAALEALASEIVGAGGTAPILLTADFTAPGGIEALADAALTAVGRIDILVNNAGGSRPMTDPTDEAFWTEAFQLNFEAARRLTHRIAPGMVERGWGRVVNVSGALISKTLNAAAPAKAALESWSRSVAAAWAASGVTVNCVAPGRINTPQILDRLHPTDASRTEFIARNIPAGRFGDPAEAAAVIAFLASAPASYVTGVTVPVDGGGMRLAF